MCCALGVVFTVFVGHIMTMFLGWLSVFGGWTMALLLVCLLVVVYTMVVCMVLVLRRLGNV